MKSLVVVLALAALALQGCATAVNKKLDDKLSQESGIQSRKDLSTEAKTSIAHIPGLTPEQKNSLIALKNSTESQVNAASLQSLKLRALLVQDLLSENYDRDEVALIKTRLTDLEEQRLKVIFDAVSKANEILGRKAIENKKVFNDFFDRQGSRD